MRFLVQRVTRASVSIDKQIHSAIGPGLLVLIGIAATDTPAQADYLADKLVNLRIFDDADGRINLSAVDTKAELLLVSQFTLYADCTKGRRPGFDAAAKPEPANQLYQYVVQKIASKGLPTKTGVFQAHMQVELINDGPSTYLLEAKADSDT